MSVDPIVRSHEPGPENRPEAAAGDGPVPRARTPRMIAIGIGLMVVFVILLIAGVAPRVRNSRELATAAETVRTAAPGVSIIRPQRASEADLSLAATTQAIQDSIIYARTSGYIARRYVDIGDHVKAGQLLAQIASPEVDQELSQTRAVLRQS